MVHTDGHTMGRGQERAPYWGVGAGVLVFTLLWTLLPHGQVFHSSPAALVQVRWYLRPLSDASLGCEDSRGAGKKDSAIHAQEGDSHWTSSMQEQMAGKPSWQQCPQHQAKDDLIYKINSSQLISLREMLVLWLWVSFTLEKVGLPIFSLFSPTRTGSKTSSKTSWWNQISIKCQPEENRNVFAFQPCFKAPSKWWLNSIFKQSKCGGQKFEICARGFWKDFLSFMVSSILVYSISIFVKCGWQSQADWKKMLPFLPAPCLGVTNFFTSCKEMWSRAQEALLNLPFTLL